MAHQTYPLGLPSNPPPQPEVIEKVDPYTEILLTDGDGNVTQLSIKNGDVIATAIKGPNYGKSCNLTYGHWE
jgi:hypothetical protein